MRLYASKIHLLKKDRLSSKSHKNIITFNKSRENRCLWRSKHPTERTKSSVKRVREEKSGKIEDKDKIKLLPLSIIRIVCFCSSTMNCFGSNVSANRANYENYIKSTEGKSISMRQKTLKIALALIVISVCHHRLRILLLPRL